MPLKPPYHEYLGDGVYVSFDGSYLVLRTGSHNSNENVVMLEPEVLAALTQYMEKLAEILNNEN